MEALTGVADEAKEAVKDQEDQEGIEDQEAQEAQEAQEVQAVQAVQAVRTDWEIMMMKEATMSAAHLSIAASAVIVQYRTTRAS
jgi:hypothetical protein